MMKIVPFKNAEDLINPLKTYREKSEEVVSLKIVIDGYEYTLNEYNGKLEIRVLNGALKIHPQAQNMILLSVEAY